MPTLLEITLQKLQKTTVDAFPDTGKRQHQVGNVSISNIKFIPYEPSKELKIEAVAVSGSNRYKCSITFEDVYYEATAAKELSAFKGVDGKEYNIHLIDTNVNDVKVKCSCMDFYYRFAQSNYQKDGLDGNPPPPYVKKTDRPPVNPTNAPGMCKHLLKLHEQLETIGLVS